MIGTGYSKVSSGVHSYLYDPDMDFKPAPSGEIQLISPGPIADQQTWAMFDDSHAKRPIGVLVTQEGGGRVVLDRLLLDRPIPELAFVLGRSLEYLRSGHALINRLAFDDRLLLCELLGGLLHSSAEGGADLAQEFRRDKSRKVVKQIDDLVEAYAQHVAQGGEEEPPSRWLAAVDRSANQHGLLACDEIGAALRMLAQLGGQELAIGPAGEVSVQLVSDGPALVSFFLSSDYLTLRRKVSRS